MAIASDNDMVMDQDPKRLTCIHDVTCHGDIRVRWGRVTGWVIMHQDDRCSRKFQSAFDDFAWIDWRVIYGTSLLYFVSDKSVSLIKK